MGRAALSLALLLAACDTITVAPAPPADDPVAPPEAVEEPGDAPCESLSRGLCLRSLVCTLASPSSEASTRYVCRAAQGNCEVGLTQTRDDLDRCSDRAGCMWRDGPCYCPCRGAGRTAVEDGEEASACQCECGGGPPPGCVPRE